MTEPALKIAFISSDSPQAIAAKADLEGLYESTTAEQADILVVLGGDGFMLTVLHANLGNQKKIYGMNRGTIGFLLNAFDPENLLKRLTHAETLTLFPLKMTVEDAAGKMHIAHAINEVYAFRETHQAAKLQIMINGKEQMDCLTCDGLLLATPAGSTAYNFSAHGPILPINSNLLALTPISAFRPRRWRGALIPHKQIVKLKVLEPEKRPVSAVADYLEIRDALHIQIEEDRSQPFQIMFDSKYSLEEKILDEQFQGHGV